MKTMTQYDLREFRALAANLKRQMDQCDNGEGMDCSSLDTTLLHYAEWCDEYRERTCEWARCVFSGKVRYDQRVEETVIDEGIAILTRASEWLGMGLQGEGECFTIEAIGVLEPATLRLRQMLVEWVTPRLSVSPSPRHSGQLSADAIDRAKELISKLPPLPKDWQPDNNRQAKRYKLVRDAILKAKAPAREAEGAR